MRDVPVVLYSGAGGSTSVWEPVVELLDQPTVRVPRPGLDTGEHWGWADGPVLEEEVRRVVALLPTAPAVLVGHSMGAFVVEAVARLHPDRVSGLVLIDGSVELQPSPPKRARRLGGAHLVGRLLGSQVHAALLDVAVYPDFAADLHRLRSRWRLPPIPVVLAVALPRRSSAWSRAWLARQRRLAEGLAREAGSVEVVEVRPSGHQMMRDRPEVVAELIRRTSSSWSP